MRFSTFCLLLILAAPTTLRTGPLQANPSTSDSVVVFKNDFLGLKIEILKEFFASVETLDPLPCKIQTASQLIKGTIRQTDMGDFLLEWDGGSARLDLDAAGAQLQFLLKPETDSLRYVEERIRLTECHAAGRQLVLFLLAYAADHNGTMPAKLSDLIPDYVEDRVLMDCSLAADRSSPGWNYNPKTKETEPLLVSKSKDSLGRHLEIFSDGTVRFSEVRK